MSDFSPATPASTLDRDSAQVFARILQELDAAMYNHGSKNYIEKADFVDIMLDIRKLAFDAIDVLDSDH